MGGGREVKERGDTVYLQLTHVDTWQRPAQYCEAIFLPLKISKFFGGGDYLQVRFKQLL